MVHDYLLYIILLMLSMLLLVMLGQKLRISYPIFLVIAGLLISFIPGLPKININPDLIFLIFLPPILYEAAWYTSWRDFWKWRRPINLLAFGLVFFTSMVIAYVSRSFIPGFTLALGFLLGGVISPPDAVAATSVLKGNKIPKRALTILEGESLINDASSLIVFKFALAAIITGSFVMEKAIGDFFMLAAGGIAVGLITGAAVYYVHKFLPTTASIDTAFTLITPYLMYIIAEQFHFSGVLAVVTGGLFLSYRAHDFLTHASRIQAINVWNTLVFLINGIIFILIGLQLPVITFTLGPPDIVAGVLYGLALSLILLLVRFAWVYVATFLPRSLFRSIRETEANPGWKGPFIVGYAAMRGVVSLAAALSIPFVLPSGDRFPQRSMVLLITFTVIIVTLVGQGLTLPVILKMLRISDSSGDTAPLEEQEAGIKLRLKKVALKRLDEKHAETIAGNVLVANMRRHLETDTLLIQEKLDSLQCEEGQQAEMHIYYDVMRDLIGIQRAELALLRTSDEFEDEILRKQGFHLDLDEVKLSGM